jgi:hypothetical protein
MTEIFSQIPKKPLTRSTISRYNPHVDNYAKAPMRRLFHLVDLSSRTDTAVSRITCNDLHTLIFGQVEQVPRYQQLPHSLKKHRGCTPIIPISEPSERNHAEPGHPLAVIASQIPGLSFRSWRDRRLRSARAVETADALRHRAPSGPPSVLTCNKKAICPTLAGNAVASSAVNLVIPSTHTDLQETDR